MHHAPDLTLPRRTLVLLAVAVFVNFADRGNLSTVAPVLGHELGLSHTSLGLLLSSFFWTYAPGQLLGGWLAQRFSVRGVLALGLFLWSEATFLTGLAHGFAIILGLRLVLGFGESVVFPAIAQLLAERLPEARRGAANGVVLVGLALGPIAGTLAGGWILLHFGWRWVFFVFGSLSMLWLLPWLATPLAANPRAGTPGGYGPGYRQIMRQRIIWGAALGHFCANYTTYLLLTWMPSYLVGDRHFSIAAMTLTGAAVYGCNAASSVLSGRAADHFIVRGASPNIVRKSFIITGTAGVGASMLVCAAAPTAIMVVCLLLAGFFLGLQTPTMYAIAQTLSGPRAAGRWMGLQNFVGNIAGIAAPLITGWVVDATGSFFWAFVIAAILSGLGILAWAFLIGRIEPVRWQTETIGNE